MIEFRRVMIKWLYKSGLHIATTKVKVWATPGLAETRLRIPKQCLVFIRVFPHIHTPFTILAISIGCMQISSVLQEQRIQHTAGIMTGFCGHD